MTENIVDIIIYESGDGGEMNLKNDDLETISGLTNQVYLALFGGNVEQVTSEDLSSISIRNDYWGNALLEDELQFNSTFEKMLNKVALNSNGISKLEDAAKKDLEYLTEYADITISRSIPAINKFQLDVKLVEPDNLSTKIKFLWDATKNELIETIII